MKEERKIFLKTFAYTMLLLILMTGATVALFARQFLSICQSGQARQLADVFAPLTVMLSNKPADEILGVAKNFYEKNQSFDFVIEDAQGSRLFATPNFTDDISLSSRELPGGMDSPDARQLSMRGGGSQIFLQLGGEKGGFMFRGTSAALDSPDYGELIQKSLLMLLLMLGIAALGAVVFAQKIAQPLVEEVKRERRMEENQRAFFSSASHELKTPIAAMTAVIEGMTENIGDYRDHPKYLRECLKMLDSQNRLVSETLEIVRLSDEKLRPVSADFGLSGALLPLLAEYRPMAEQNSLTIQADIPALTVHTDKAMLRRALSNVIANAVQNTAENGTVHIWAAAGEGVVRVHVLNSGARIDADAPAHLFEPFYRHDTARNRGDGRSGLGLTIVKKLLDRLHISFALENTDRGVLFWLDVPAGEGSNISSLLEAADSADSTNTLLPSRKSAIL
jgi:two-component system sensor histidine kinase VanS